MPKNGNNNLSEYGKILADNLSLLRRNGSPQEFEKSLNDLIGSLETRFRENQNKLLYYQNDLLDIEKAYKPDDDRIFGSKETVSTEISRNLKDSTELNKILTGLKTLSNDVSQKKDVGSSIDQFRANIGASPEVKPNFFARVQTFFANLFTDNKNQQKTPP